MSIRWCLIPSVPPFVNVILSIFRLLFHLRLFLEPMFDELKVMLRGESGWEQNHLVLHPRSRWFLAFLIDTFDCFGCGVLRSTPRRRHPPRSTSSFRDRSRQRKGIPTTATAEMTVLIAFPGFFRVKTWFEDFINNSGVETMHSEVITRHFWEPGSSLNLEESWCKI